MNRRTFIKSTAAITAFPAIVSSSVFGAESPGKQITFGCIGVGRMGCGDMKHLLSQGLSRNARVVAVCDLDRDRATAAAGMVDSFYKQELSKDNWGCKIYGDFRELIARSDIDAVLIVTPDHWHAIPAIAAANAGKDIYLEKPLTYTVEEGQKLVQAVRKNKVILQTGSMQRSSVYFRKACEVVRNGMIGKLQTIEVVVPTDSGRGKSDSMPIPANLNYDMWLGSAPDAPYTQDRVHPQNGYGRPGWLQIEAYSRGMITGWGAHMYDIAQWGMGTDVDSGPVEISAEGEFPDRGLFDVHVGYKGEATYANGVKMVSHNGAAGVRFTGADGWVWVDRSKFEAPDRDIFRQPVPENGVKLYESKDHMVNFLECIVSRKDPITPVEVGHRSNTVCILHWISMKLGGRKLQWDPKAERFVKDDEANSMLGSVGRGEWKI